MEESDFQTRSSPQESPMTNITTPDVASEDDDIWASDGNQDPSDVAASLSARDDMLSDLPTIKRQHMTDGYREGLSIGKAKVMQNGFDAGYPIGVAIALRAGKVLGCIEGILAAKDLSDENRFNFRKIMDQAKQELAITVLLRGMNDQDIVSFEDIPSSIEGVLSKWEDRVLGTSRSSETIGS